MHRCHMTFLYLFEFVTETNYVTVNSTRSFLHFDELNVYTCHIQKACF